MADSDSSGAKFSLDMLAGFSGGETFYRHSIVQSVVYTEGVQFLAERAEACWLLDEIAVAQILPRVKTEEFQCWVLKVAQNKSATLTCDDGNGRVILSKQIEYTDFPLAEIKLYCTGNTIMLPGEY